jgi:hypothetical protein
MSYTQPYCRIPTTTSAAHLNDCNFPSVDGMLPDSWFVDNAKNLYATRKTVSTSSTPFRKVHRGDASITRRADVHHTPQASNSSATY